MTDATTATAASNASVALRADRPSSLFRRLMLGFSAVIVLVALAGFTYVAFEAKATQRGRTASENAAHTREVLLHMTDVASDPVRMHAAAAALEQVRSEMFRDLSYHSRVRLRVWKDGQLVYNSLPQLPDVLPAHRSADVNAWVSAVVRDAASGVVVERSHEVDDDWMLSFSGVSFLLSSTIFSLPLLLLPAWLIVGIGLRPLRSIADAIEQRSVSDLTALPESKYRELSPLVAAINRLMMRLSQRIEREHEFLSDAAHELKTPLAAIQINAHLLLSRSGAANNANHANHANHANAVDDAADGLRDGVARATHMVHQLLALERARTEPGVEPLPQTDLCDFARTRLAAAAPLAMERGIEIELHADAPCAMPLHHESMAALLDNLIGNAIKYSPEGGQVTVRVAAHGDGYRLTVADQGPGIAPQLRQKVFERFYRIPGQEQSGSGLGLAIAERAAERNDAVITLADGEADTDGGAGLTVIVDIPGRAAI